MNDASRAPLARDASVQQDWRAWLPAEKAQVFRKHEQHLESLYNMFSVSLNEAIELKQAGLIGKSLMAVGMTSELCERLSRPLAGMLRALREHAKHYGTVPNAAPLDAANYQGLKGQRLARLNSLLNRVLLSHRLQFLQKVSTLEEMVDDLEKDYCLIAGDLADGVATNPDGMWHEMDADHYDLNTCLRETMVLFKSFLVVLPVSQLVAFQVTVRDQSLAPSRVILTRHRRIAAIAGQ